MMTANLYDANGGLDFGVDVPSQRAFPPFIAYDGNVYQCRNVASSSGDYDLVGRVHVIDAEAKSANCETPKGVTAAKEGKSCGEIDISDPNWQSP